MKIQMFSTQDKEKPVTEYEAVKLTVVQVTKLPL
jgi:hypothetical protein